MAKFSRFHKIALVSLGAVGGGFAYYHLNSDRNVKKVHLLTPMKEFSSSMKWDSNWDCREPENLVRPLKNNSAEEENRVNQDLENARPKATRHLFLIRHGQYHIDGATDKERTLTELGRKQAELTGKRLAALDIKWDLLVRSTMTRAQETAAIIAKHLPCDIVIKDCQMLEEGAPIPPEPAVGHWKPEAKQFFQDSARIEAAFRKYFHRAPPEQLENSYTVLVCHANVIRYFVCKSDIEYQQRKRSAASECDTSSSDEEHTKKTTSKAKPKSSRSEPKKKRGRKAKSTRALQFPPEGWLRISLNHGSITWISILPNGHVVLRALGDTGYMDPAHISSR